MFDARTFPHSLESAEQILNQNGADFKGDYRVIDKIYVSRDPAQTLDKVFLRLRLIPKNIWADKAVVVSIKNTELKKVGKQSIIPVKESFDTEAEAKEFIQQNYSDQFLYSYEFDRTGKQYFLGEDGIDLENIEGHYSIEFKSKTEEGLRKLLSVFKVEESDVITGPSVVVIKQLLGR